MYRRPREDPRQFEKRFYLVVLVLVILGGIGYVFGEHLPSSPDPQFMLMPAPNEEQWEAVKPKPPVQDKKIYVTESNGRVG